MRGPRVILVIVISAFAAVVAAQQKPPAPSSPGQAKSPDAKLAEQREPGLYMTLETEKGAITCKLFEKEAPQTVRAIVGLALGKKPYTDPRTRQRVTGRRFYDGLIFHRVIPNFMIQGGDPLGSGTGDVGFTIPAEFRKELNFDVPGRLAMARLPTGINTASSQFFITEVPYPYLNQQYTIFGQCGNLDVVKAIARVPRDQNDRPRTLVHMKRVIIERVGPVPPDAPEATPAAKAPGKKSAKKAPAKKSS